MAFLTEPGGNKYIVVRGLMDICATKSLIERDLLHNQLSAYADVVTPQSQAH